VTARRRYRRRYRPRVYLHLGCLGCSIPLLGAFAVGLVLAVLA
jgi:hypothetical protein